MKTVDEIIAEIKSRANGRTRHEGQQPFWDEVLVAEIEDLRRQLTELADRYNHDLALRDMAYDKLKKFYENARSEEKWGD